MRSPLTHRLLVTALAALCAAPFAAAMTPTDLSARLARNEPLLVVDVRSATAYAAGHVPGAINIPLALLPHKALPNTQPVIVYGDGLGVVDETQALTALRAKPGVNADVLEGGYAAWLAAVRLSTGATGVAPEKLPVITYDQLVASKTDVMIVDLRTPAPAAPAARSASANANAAAAPTTDVVSNFAKKIGASVVQPKANAAAPQARRQAVNAGPAANANAVAVEALPSSDKLLVLVADNEADANEAARQLRARGNYRFTILVGGTEAIRHEGKVGSGRMDGGLPVTPTP